MQRLPRQTGNGPWSPSCYRDTNVLMEGRRPTIGSSQLLFRKMRQHFFGEKISSFQLVIKNAFMRRKIFILLSKKSFCHKIEYNFSFLLLEVTCICGGCLRVFELPCFGDLCSLAALFHQRRRHQPAAWALSKICIHVDLATQQGHPRSCLACDFVLLAT